MQEIDISGLIILGPSHAIGTPAPALQASGSGMITRKTGSDMLKILLELRWRKQRIPAS